MAYDPTKPANNSLLSSSEMRAQLAGLKSEIDTKVTADEVNNAIISGSAGPVAGQIEFLSLIVSNPPTQAQVQAIADKLDELMSLLKRI